MVKIKAFPAVRPSYQEAEAIADHPYDVVSTEETRAILQDNPRSILKVDRAESTLDGVAFDDPIVYEKARALLEEMIQKGELAFDDQENLYLYEQTFRGRVQRGLVGLSSVQDYQEGIIRIHEKTIPAKEADRTNHIDRTGFHIGPIFLIYRASEQIKALLDQGVEEGEPIFDFVKYETRHRGFRIPNPAAFIEEFQKLDAIYVADGHHRSKSAVNVFDRDQQSGVIRESDYFLSVAFPSDEVSILPYHRYLRSLKGLEFSDFLSQMEKFCEIQQLSAFTEPLAKYQITIYADGHSHRLTLKPEYRDPDPLRGLDVYNLQRIVLEGIFHMGDPRLDPDMEFIGGIRGLDYLKDLVDQQGGMAIAMYPTDIQDLLAVADRGDLMPAKSTWFEPKLLNGLFLHKM